MKSKQSTLPKLKPNVVIKPESPRSE